MKRFQLKYGKKDVIKSIALNTSNIFLCLWCLESEKRDCKIRQRWKESLFDRASFAS